ncbi:carboxypeptidase B-like [Amphiura filiformis]|uniref:carboxypeptidase B-like n=1 Tax=Amphiura filiformis TaxID=82378 RepID=UPI003B226AC6
MSRVNTFRCILHSTILILLVGLCRSRYTSTQESFQVLRIDAKNESDVQWLNGIMGRLEEKMGADFWTNPTTIQPVDIMLPFHSIGQFESLLQERDMIYSVMLENVEDIIESQMKNMRRRRDAISKDISFDYGIYHTYEEIRQWVKDISSEHSDIVEEFVVAKSYEGRQVAGVKISVPNGRKNKKSVWFEGGIHAREWIAPATVLFLAKQLIYDFRNGEPDVQRILHNLDFYIVPSLNVDGYAYTWSKNRLWRKTRSPTWNPFCKGTDGNRNWPYEWGGVRASKKPCNETYRGTGPASEVEIQGVVDFTRNLTKTQDFAVFIDWHSYSQAWMAPWSYSAQAPPPSDAADQLALAEAAVQAIKTVHGTDFRAGAAATTLYEASGFSIDWSYAVLKAKYSFCVELRDRGRYGFLLPEDQIIPTGEECYAAVKVVANKVVDEIGV